MLLILLGKTCSGKTEITKELVKRGWAKVVTDTTRPKRKGERNGKDYNFISDSEFEMKKSSGYYMETKSYVMADGKTVKYGSPIKSIRESGDVDTVLIVTPDGYRDFLKRVTIPHKSIYIYTNRSTALKRLKKRGDNADEASRRINADNIDFKGIETLVDKIVYNNDGTDLAAVVNKIEDLIKK